VCTARLRAESVHSKSVNNQSVNSQSESSRCDLFVTLAGRARQILQQAGSARDCTQACSSTDSHEDERQAFAYKEEGSAVGAPNSGTRCDSEALDAVC
jgi:hypothetical protein